MLNRIYTFYVNDFKKNTFNCIITILFFIKMFAREEKFFMFITGTLFYYMIARCVVKFAAADFVLGFLPVIIYLFSTTCYIYESWNFMICIVLIVLSIYLLEKNQHILDNKTYVNETYSKRTTDAGRGWAYIAAIPALVFAFLASVTRASSIQHFVGVAMCLGFIVISIRYSIVRAVIKYCLQFAVCIWAIRGIYDILSGGASTMSAVSLNNNSGNSSSDSEVSDILDNSTTDINNTSTSDVSMDSVDCISVDNVEPFIFSENASSSCVFPVDPGILYQSVLNGNTVSFTSSSGILTLSVGDGKICGPDGLAMGYYSDTITGTNFYDKAHNLTYSINLNGDYIKPDGNVFAHLDKVTNTITSSDMSNKISFDKTGSVFLNGLPIGRISK